MGETLKNIYYDLGSFVVKNNDVEVGMPLWMMVMLVEECDMKVEVGMERIFQ